MAFARPRIPEYQDILFPVQEAAFQQRRFRRQPLEVEVLQGLLQRERRVFQQPLHPGFPPLLAFPRDHLQQILLIAQRLSFRPPRRLFVAAPHRGQVQIFQMPDQRRAYVGDGAHCRTAMHNWSKLARSTGATFTIVTGGIVSSLASNSRIDSTVITASAFPSSRSRKAASTWTSPSSAASCSSFKYSFVYRLGVVSFSAS